MVNKPRLKQLHDFLEGKEQLQNFLSNGKKKCCLGWACELYRLETGEGEWISIPLEEPEKQHDAFVLGDDKCESTLPSKVEWYFGFTDNEGDLGIEYTVEGSEYINLIDANDRVLDGFKTVREMILEAIE